MNEAPRPHVLRRSAIRIVLALALAAGFAFSVPATALADADDNISGAVLLSLSGYPLTGTLNEHTDRDDVFYIDLVEGQEFVVSLVGVAGTDFDLYLFGPGSTDIWSDDIWYGADSDSNIDSFSYGVPQSGRYYLDVSVFSGSGDYSLNCSIIKGSVYRFYNTENGSHFYTASAGERDIVMDRWPDIYTYEGAAYVVNPDNPENNDPLYRFYNVLNGSHFYTASSTERDTVMARWPHIYTYEGPVYNVCTNPSAAGAMPMYRFYNMRIGSHFYTISNDERITVINRWSNVYLYEGPAFWVAP